MKVIAVLEGAVEQGGGFNQGLSAVLQMRQLCEGRFEFAVLTTLRSNVEHLRKMGVTAEAFQFSLLDRLLGQLSACSWWPSVQMRLRVTGPFEKRLLADGCDLVYFAAPSTGSGALQRLNFITSLWDLCHRDAPEFPESREFGQFELREHQQRTRLAHAFAILTDSPALAASAARRYGLDPERLLPMPFAPAPFLESGLASDKASVLQKRGLDEGYFFYPAQFWAHKNHVRIVQAFTLLRSRGALLRVVFAGGDKGNRAHVENLVRQNGLQEQVRFLGFVPAEEMRGLYEGCRAVVMPTYFGPTNIPPLEAWAVGKPLIYSSQFKDQVGDAAICVDPDDAAALADGIQACTDDHLCARLVASGHRRLQEMARQRAEAESELLLRLQRFQSRRACWS